MSHVLEIFSADLVAALEEFARACTNTLERIQTKEDTIDVEAVKEQFER